MTYNPNEQNRGLRDDGTARSNTGFIVGGLIAVALVIGGFYAYSHSDGNSHSADNTGTSSTVSSAPAGAPASPSRPANSNTPGGPTR